MRPNSARHERGGFVLIVVLATVLLLSTLLFGFSLTARRKLEAADSFYRTEQAWSCARAGLHIALATIAEANDLYTDPRLTKLTTGENTFDVADGSCSITIAEENGLLNVNSLKDKDGRLRRARIDQLLRLIDRLNRREKTAERIDYGIVAALIDWIDADDEVTSLPFVEHDNRGAEDAYYQTCEPPYHCRNAPVDILDEMRWVKGMTPEALSRLGGALTTLGDDKTNINAAPPLVLQCLSEEMAPALVEMIVNRRTRRPFQSIAELRDVPGMTDNIYQSIKDNITVDPKDRWFRVVAQGDSGGRNTRIEAIVRRNTRAQNVDIVVYREL
ncbi:MAG: type II secretion system minor pseudopilin GspK [Sedimentisphaerales bacterium]|nr:type II secretion system minor pseudopilin GspK [Sedimentisphaerales bacterium]